MVENVQDLDRICNVLDKLTLDALTLMQEEIDLKLNAENAMIGGENHLAKTRYIQGHNSVSSLQLPTESSQDINALTVLHKSTDESSLTQFSLETHKADKDKGLSDPIKWFGFMPPQNLYFAQNLYRQALQWIIQAANIQLRLEETFINIGQLRNLKQQLKATEITSSQ